MTTRERIDADMLRAAKEKNAPVLSTLRMLKSAVKNAEIEKMKPLEEADVVAVVSREMKKLKDGLESYAAGKRDDLAEQAKKEIATLEAYVPQQMSDDELMALAKRKIEETGAAGPKDFGKVMGAVMKETQGKADGARVTAAVKSILG